MVQGRERPRGWPRVSASRPGAFSFRTTDRPGTDTDFRTSCATSTVRLRGSEPAVRIDGHPRKELRAYPNKLRYRLSGIARRGFYEYFRRGRAGWLSKNAYKTQKLERTRQTTIGENSSRLGRRAAGVFTKIPGGNAVKLLNPPWFGLEETPFARFPGIVAEPGSPSSNRPPGQTGRPPVVLRIEAAGRSRPDHGLFHRGACRSPGISVEKSPVFSVRSNSSSFSKDLDSCITRQALVGVASR